MKLIDEEGIIKLRNLIKNDIQEVRNEIPDFPKDAYPIEGSHNPIESGGVYDALADKQDILTFDNTPTANSENPVKSGGVYQVVTGKQDRLTFDEVPTIGSQNMVRSGAIALALNNKNDMATPVDTISSSVDNPVKSSAIYEALQGKQDTLTFDAVPTEGSDNVVRSNGIYEALSHAGGTPDWNQSDSDGVGYINNRTHYIEYTFSEKLIDASTIDWNDSSTSNTIGGVSYKLIYTLSSNINGALRTTGKFRVSFGNKYAIASSTYSYNAYRTAVEDLGLYILTTSSTIYVYVNWESPSQLLTIEKVTSETYHKLDNNYLDISTTPTSGSAKPISSGAVYSALESITPGVSLTEAAYLQLTENEKNNGTVYYVTDRKVICRNGVVYGIPSWNVITSKPTTLTGYGISVDTAPTENSTNPVTSGGVYNAVLSKENTSNKKTEITAASTDTDYPSAKAVWKLFNNLERRIARLEAELGGGTSAVVEDNILEVFNGEENDNILELNDRSYVDENNILNFINSSSTASVDNNILTDDSISVDNGILNVPNATVDDSMIDLG